mgnify:CR=1 FL=1
MKSCFPAVLAAVAVLWMLASAGPAQIARKPAARTGTVSIPYRMPGNDPMGNQWLVYHGGRIQQQGNMPVYSESGMLFINGNNPGGNTNQARLEENGELVVEGLSTGGCSITRRFMLNRDEGYIRVVDIIKNTTAQDQNLNIMLRSSINYGVQSSQVIADTRRKDQPMGSVLTDGQGRAILELYALRGSKLVPNIQAQPNNSYITANFTLAVPAGKQAAFVHLHGVVAGTDAAEKLVATMKESKVLDGLPRELRKILANAGAGESYIGDFELVRGELLDVVELRTQDRLQGTIKEQAYRMQTFYGPVELPVERVVGLINVGDFRPRQLLVTTDGEIFGGRLQKETLALELSSGQLMQIPLSQISRAGYRRRAGEAEEWNFDKPLVLMRSGDRVCVQMPSEPIEVVTRYGRLKLAPPAIAAISFQAEGHSVHQVHLADGSRFAGLVAADRFEMKLSGGQKEQVVSFPTGSMLRFQTVADTREPDSASAVAELANGDVLVGKITGPLKLDTAFDTVALEGEQIRGLAPAREMSSDVQVTLWDETTISGQLQEAEVSLLLESGLKIMVPVALIRQYTQPRPEPSEAVVRNIRELVTQLSADDWKQRDVAQQKLMKLGTAVISTLKALRAQQDPEAQQRIDKIVNALESPKSRGPQPPAVPGQMIFEE